MKKLVIIAVASVSFALISFFMSPSYKKNTIIGNLIFPEIADKINGIDKIKITSKHGEVNITKDDDGIFKVEEMSGFKAKEERIKSILLGISRLEYFEKKTSDKERYKELRVEDISDDSRSYLLEVFEKGSSNAFSLILGDSILGISGFSNGIFIRKPTEEQVWLARSSFDITGTPLQFIDNKIMNISFEDIKSVTIKQDGLLYKIEDDRNDILKFFHELDFYMAEKDYKTKEVIAGYLFEIKGGISVLIEKIKAETGNPTIRITVDKQKAMTIASSELYNKLKEFEGWLFKIDAFKLNYLLEMRKDDKKN